MINDLFADAGLRPDRIFIDGQWAEASTADRFELTNPKDESALTAVALGSEEDAARAISAAEAAQPAWQQVSAIDRGNILLKLADLMEQHSEQLAKIAMLEHGKTIATARGEVGFASLIIRYNAWSSRHLVGEIRHDENPHEQLWTQKVPFGVVAGITPWNFPLVVAARKIGPALVTGNAIVLKPHELTPLSTLYLAELCKQAGVPRGIVNVVVGGGRTVGNALVTDPRIRMISMTGSSRGGREIYAAAAPGLKVVRLELGGKAPFIVLNDADIDKAVAAALASKFYAGGQICTANERMYIQEGVYDQFMEKFVAGVNALKVGDPETDVAFGPWVSRAEVDKLDRIASEAESDGARQLNDAPAKTDIHQKGRWTFPRVFEVKDNAPRLMREETFGPIVAALKVSDFDQAVHFANQTEYGLTAFVWTDSNRKIMRAIQELEFGEVYVNRGNGESVHGFHTGFKASGLGGEDGIHGLEGYLRKKSVYNNYA